MKRWYQIGALVTVLGLLCGLGLAQLTQDTSLPGGLVQRQTGGDYYPSGKRQTFASGATLETLSGATATFDAATVTNALSAGSASVTGALSVGSMTQGVEAATNAKLTTLTVKKKAIADNTATSVITVTVPNANHAAAVRVTILATLGTGTDAFESSRVATGTVVVARTTGANVVAVVSTIAQAQIATVASGGTLTLAYGVSAVSGAVGAVNTVDIQVTLVVTGTITDHQCVIYAELLNSEAAGVTMAAS